MSVPTPAPAFITGIVKQVQSGDTVIIRKATGCPPPEKVITLSGISAPKLARQKTANNDTETKDEPFAWEAREFLRKKLVGKTVKFTAEKPPNSVVREYGNVWVTNTTTNKEENIAELLIMEGLAKVREGSRNIPQLKRLVELEEVASSQKKGIWGPNAQEHVRDLKWVIENPKQFVNKYNGKPIKAIVEYVRDGSTVRVFLLPECQFITLMISGIRCPTIKQNKEVEPYAEEARFFVETRLLQRDVEVILETVNNNNFVGTIMHPQGNIAEVLLKSGLAKCVDWSLAVMKSGASVLREAEKSAKDAKLRMWSNYVSNAPIIAAKDKNFQATVLEVVNGDCILLTMPNRSIKKIFLASIRPPREKIVQTDDKPSPKRKFRALYDVPWLFECREFLRKKLVGKKVNVIVEYIQTSIIYPEKTCCTVIVGGVNVAEALVAKGYATVSRYRNDDDQRSSQYDKLLEAELKAQKAGIGIHAKKDIPQHRVQDTTNDSAMAKKFFPFLKRAQKIDAIVEFVPSGARMRLYIPKESVLVTFLLTGVTCPRATRPGILGGTIQDADLFGDEAQEFTRDRCLQRDVKVTIEDMDKAGTSFIGWLWVDNENFAVTLVEHGFASMYHTAETSEYARAIKMAQESAKNKRIGIWQNYVEEEKEIEREKQTQVEGRTIKYEKVVITEITPEGTFYAQFSDHGTQLEALMEKIRQECTANPPVPGSFTPRRGNICAARFTADDQWYRAKVEKIQDGKVAVLYIDYGNREILHSSRLAVLPASLQRDLPYATEYALACVKFPSDPDDRLEAVRALSMDILNVKMMLNIEAKTSPPAVTLVDPTGQDVGKALIKEGLVLVENTRDRRLAGLLSEYLAAQEHAKSSRINLWRHGDITDDDAVEFGSRR